MRRLRSLFRRKLELIAAVRDDRVELLHVDVLEGVNLRYVEFARQKRYDQLDIDIRLLLAQSRNRIRAALGPVIIKHVEKRLPELAARAARPSSGVARLARQELAHLVALHMPFSLVAQLLYLHHHIFCAASYCLKNGFPDAVLSRTSSRDMIRKNPRGISCSILTSWRTAATRLILIARHS